MQCAQIAVIGHRLLALKTQPPVQKCLAGITMRCLARHERQSALNQHVVFRHDHQQLRVRAGKGDGIGPDQVVGDIHLAVGQCLEHGAGGGHQPCIGLTHGAHQCPVARRLTGIGDGIGEAGAAATRVVGDHATAQQLPACLQQMPEIPMTAQGIARVAQSFAVGQTLQRIAARHHHDGLEAHGEQLIAPA